jgi:hypothetical protein
MVRIRIARLFAAFSLVVLLAACGGEGATEKEDAPDDQEKRSLTEPQGEDDDRDKKDNKDEKESRGDGDDDGDD